MVGYKELLKKLLSKEDPHTVADDAYFVTIYVETYGLSRNQVETHIKSLLSKGFADNAELKDETKIRKRIWEQILVKIKDFEFFNRGLAIFVQFSLAEEDCQIELVDLLQSPESESFVGKNYDLDQLLWISDITKNALVLRLQFNNAGVYVLQGKELKFLEEISYELEDDLKEYQQKYSPQRGEGLYHGTGETNKQRQLFEFSKRFFSDVIDQIKDKYLQKYDVEYIVIFRSSFYDVISEYVDSELQKLPNLTPIVFSKNIETESVLKEETIQAINNSEGESKRRLLDEARNNYKLYAKGWGDVASAARSKRIRDLFIVLNIPKKGYVDENGLVYTHVVDNAKEVSNMAPRLIQETLEQGGNVYVFKDKDILADDVEAILRF